MPFQPSVIQRIAIGDMLRRAGFAVDVYLPACRAIAEDTAKSACAEMRAAGIALHASLDELDAALNMDGDN